MTSAPDVPFNLSGSLVPTIFANFPSQRGFMTRIVPVRISEISTEDCVPLKASKRNDKLYADGPPGSIGRIVDLEGLATFAAKFPLVLRE